MTLVFGRCTISTRIAYLGKYHGLTFRLTVNLSLFQLAVSLQRRHVLEKLALLYL